MLVFLPRAECAGVEVFLNCMPYDDISNSSSDSVYLKSYHLFIDRLATVLRYMQNCCWSGSMVDWSL